MDNNFRGLTEEYKAKFELLKEHFRGLVPFLSALRGVGYIPDHGNVKLTDAMDKLYKEAEDNAIRG